MPFHGPVQSNGQVIDKITRFKKPFPSRRPGSLGVSPHPLDPGNEGPLLVRAHVHVVPQTEPVLVDAVLLVVAAAGLGVGNRGDDILGGGGGGKMHTNM